MRDFINSDLANITVDWRTLEAANITKSSPEFELHTVRPRA